jgi:hypothetical protein
LLHRDLYVAAYQCINTRRMFLWKLAGEQNYSTQRAGLGGNGSLCLIERAPDFDAMKPTNSAKRTPSTGNKPGDTALKARAHSVSASLVTTKYAPPAMRNVATKTIKAIHATGRLRNQSAIIDCPLLGA